MPKPIDVSFAFLSSPSDVKSERQIFERVAAELNSVFLQSAGHMIWPIMWEHMFGGIGIDQQDVINRQTPLYDVFVGIVWSRFGTPTTRFGSGTQEEFENALRIYLDHRELEFMLFVKRENLPNDIDEIQLQKLRNFIRVLSSNGILFQEFKTETEFESLVRKNLLNYLTNRPKAVRQNYNDEGENQSNLDDYKPARMLLPIINSFSQELNKAFELMKGSNLSQRTKGSKLIVQATKEFISQGERCIRQIIRWTFAVGTREYLTAKQPHKLDDNGDIASELDSIRQQIEEWRALIGRAPVSDSAAKKDLGDAGEFMRKSEAVLSVAAGAIRHGT
jgi:hypothetical protein